MTTMDRVPSTGDEASYERSSGSADQAAARSTVIRIPTFRFTSRRYALPRKEKPRVVLLQGPVGPFFRHLQASLEKDGYDAWRVTFNAADRLFAAGQKQITFNGDRQEWATWFASFLVAADPDHIVLFGAEREIHVVARRLAEAAGVDVISLEEGYLRPGYVTVERGANNWLAPVAGKLPPVEFDEEAVLQQEGGFRGFGAMCAYGVSYYAVRTLFTGLAQRDLFHRRIRPVEETFLWTRNLYRRLVHASTNFASVQRLLEHHDKRYYLVPLQVAADTQLARAALGWTSARLIMETLRSFAHNAPPNTRLVFKIHPLERGHSRDHHLVQQTARLLGIEDRVDVLDAGSLGLLTRHAAGMITINSTSGLSAVHHGVPLLVVGEAFYANDALATCARGRPNFDTFWVGGHVAEERLRRRYLAWIRHTSLKPGDFYAREGIEIACAGVIDVIRSAPERVAGNRTDKVAASG